jgi:hypothetical protein
MHGLQRFMARQHGYRINYNCRPDRKTLANFIDALVPRADNADDDADAISILRALNE